MYALIQGGERSYYVNVPVKIGLYRVSDDEVYLIDSGGDKDAGRKLRQILDKKGWTLKAILNTHSNSRRGARSMPRGWTARSPVIPFWSPPISTGAFLPRISGISF